MNFEGIWEVAFLVFLLHAYLFIGLGSETLYISPSVCIGRKYWEENEDIGP